MGAAKGTPVVGVAALVVLAALVGGCGGDQAPAPAPATASAPAPGIPEKTTSSTLTSTAATTALVTAAQTSRPAAPSVTSATPAPSVTPTTATVTSAARGPGSTLGFGEVAFTVTPPGGTPAGAAERCALLAETGQQLARGLMGRSDLAGYDAMVFRFAADTSGAFYMRNVPVPLSIAWFAADGRFVAATDMASCPDQDGCPTYAPGAPYRYALEVLAGGLGALGVSAGSVLSLGGACNR